MKQYYKFWMVWREGSPHTRFRHGLKISAEREAERLAAECPGEVFYVLKAVSAVVAEKPEPPKIERFKLVHDPIPF